MYLCRMLETPSQILIAQGKLLPLMEEFYTIQGEGFHTGKAAYLSELAVAMLAVIGVMLKKVGMPSCIRQQVRILL